MMAQPPSEWLWRREGNDPSTLLNDLQHAEHREFAPLFADVGFRIPEESDPRSKKPKPDDPDYATKLKMHNAFCSERDVWNEIKAVRKDFSRSLQFPRPTGKISSATSRNIGRTQR